MLCSKSVFGLNHWGSKYPLLSLLGYLAVSVVWFPVSLCSAKNSQPIPFWNFIVRLTKRFLACWKSSQWWEFLMLRLKSALQQLWIEDTPQFCRCVVAGHVSFGALRGVVRELISVWDFVRDFVRFTASPHIQSHSGSTGRVR